MSSHKLTFISDDPTCLHTHSNSNSHRSPSKKKTMFSLSVCDSDPYSFFLLAWFGFVLYSINVLHIFLRHNFNNKWYFRWFSVPIYLSSYCKIIFDFFLIFPFFSFLSRCFAVICVDLSKFQWRDSFSFFFASKMISIPRCLNSIFHEIYCNYYLIKT